MADFDDIITALGIGAQVAGPFLGTPSQAELRRQAPFAARSLDAITRAASSGNLTAAQSKSLFNQQRQAFGQFGDTDPLQMLADMQTEERETKLGEGVSAISQVFGPEIAGLVQQGPGGQPDFRAALQAATLQDRRQVAVDRQQAAEDDSITGKDFRGKQDKVVSEISKAQQDGNHELAESLFENFRLSARSVGFEIPDLPPLETRPPNAVVGFFGGGPVPVPRTLTNFSEAIFSATPVGDLAPLQQGAPVSPPPLQSPVTGDAHPAIQQGLEEQRQAREVAPERFATADPDSIRASLPAVESLTEYAELAERITEPQEIMYRGVRGTIQPKNELLELPPTAEQVAEESIVPDGKSIQELEAIQPGLAMATPAAKEVKAKAEKSGAPEAVVDLVARRVVLSKQLEPLRRKLEAETKEIEKLNDELSPKPGNTLAEILVTGRAGSGQVRPARSRPLPVTGTSRKEINAQVKKAIDPVRKELAKEDLATLTEDLTERFTAEARARFNSTQQEKSQEIEAKQDEILAELQQRLDKATRLQEEIDLLSPQ